VRAETLLGVKTIETSLISMFNMHREQKHDLSIDHRSFEEFLTRCVRKVITDS